MLIHNRYKERNRFHGLRENENYFWLKHWKKIYRNKLKDSLSKKRKNKYKKSHNKTIRNLRIRYFRFTSKNVKRHQFIQRLSYMKYEMDWTDLENKIYYFK